MSNLNEKDLKILKLYEDFSNLPYVWAGSSPYSLNEQPNVPFCPYNSSRCLFEPSGSLTSNTPTSPGFDCSGFVRYAFNLIGDERFTGPKKSVSQYVDEIKLKSIREIDSIKPKQDLKAFDTLVYGHENQKGDIVWNHMGIYLGDEHMIHCSRVKNPKDIEEDLLKNWRKSFFKNHIINLESQIQRYFRDSPNEIDSLRGGISIIPIYSHQTPMWEDEHEYIGVLKK